MKNGEGTLVSAHGMKLFDPCEDQEKLCYVSLRHKKHFIGKGPAGRRIIA